jgi:teichuronic acid biosynthesis glycosyltransferase TuaG
MLAENTMNKNKQDGYAPNLVSIITPAFRVEKIILETIQSVIAQTYEQWELLIADDCSPDDTAAIIEKASQQDVRIRLLKSEKNGGPSAARNLALSAAKGRWIAFLDSDDLWLPNKLAETIEFATENNSALTFTGFRRFTLDAQKAGHYVEIPRNLTYKSLLGNTAIATSTVLIDREKTGDIVMRKAYYDDFVCWLEVLKLGYVAHGLNKDLMRYRVMSNSVSRNKLRSAKEVWKTYRQIEKINVISSVGYFISYSLNAFFKYRKY